MEREGSVNMVTRVGGVMGELGRRCGRREYEEDCRQHEFSVEILSVGPMFREPDIRRLQYYLQKPPFVRLYPL